MNQVEKPPSFALPAKDGPVAARSAALLRADSTVRVLAPLALRAVGLVAEAERLESLEPICDERTADLARSAVGGMVNLARDADAAAGLDAWYTPIFPGMSPRLRPRPMLESGRTTKAIWEAYRAATKIDILDRDRKFGVELRIWRKRQAAKAKAREKRQRNTY